MATEIVNLNATSCSTAAAIASRDCWSLPAPADRAPAQAELRWYAAYTCAQHEKRVAEQLAGRGVEHFLPLYASVRRWKDRRVRLDLPLFPGYVFVRLDLRDRLRVLQLPGVVRLVGFGGLPAALPEEQIAALRSGLSGCLHAEPHPFLSAGRRVRIVRGPLAGLKGLLLRKKGNFRFVLSVELIQRSIVLDVDAADLQPEQLHASNQQFIPEWNAFRSDQQFGAVDEMKTKFPRSIQKLKRGERT